MDRSSPEYQDFLRLQQVLDSPDAFNKPIREILGDENEDPP